MLFWVFLYGCVFYVCICTCSVQLSVFHMERRSRDTIIIIATEPTLHIRLHFLPKKWVSVTWLKSFFCRGALKVFKFKNMVELNWCYSHSHWSTMFCHGRYDPKFQRSTTTTCTNSSLLSSPCSPGKPCQPSGLSFSFPVCFCPICFVVVGLLVC